MGLEETSWYLFNYVVDILALDSDTRRIQSSPQPSRHYSLDSLECRLVAEEAEMQDRRLGEDLECGVGHADTCAEDGREPNARTDGLAREAGDGRVQLV